MRRFSLPVKALPLQHYKPNDIDILVDLNDIEKADKVLKSIGKMIV